MARYKVFAASLALLFMFSTASSLRVDINIEEMTDYGAYDFQYKENVESFQKMNVTVENLGSIGCTYKMRAVLKGENISEVEYSRGYELWPGDTALMTVRHLPLNYSGEVQGDIYVNYCGQEQLIGQANYTIENRQAVNDTVETETVNVDSRGAEIRTEDIQEGYMLPEEVPPGWEASSSKFEEGITEVSYDAPIFDSRQNLTYKVVNSGGELVGETRINLNPEKDITEILGENIWKILFVVSLLLNLGLIYNRKVKPLSEK